MPYWIGLNKTSLEMDTIYRLESKKKRSKFTPEELSARQRALVELQSEIQSIKEQQRAGYVKGYKATKLSAMEESEMFRGAPPIALAGSS